MRGGQERSVHTICGARAVVVRARHRRSVPRQTCPGPQAASRRHWSPGRSLTARCRRLPGGFSLRCRLETQAAARPGTSVHVEVGPGRSALSTRRSAGGRGWPAGCARSARRTAGASRWETRCWASLEGVGLWATALARIGGRTQVLAGPAGEFRAGSSGAAVRTLPVGAVVLGSGAARLPRSPVNLARHMRHCRHRPGYREPCRVLRWAKCCEGCRAGCEEADALVKGRSPAAPAGAYLLRERDGTELGHRGLRSSR